MTYETIMTTIAIVGVAPVVLCILYAMSSNIAPCEETLVWKVACVTWGLIATPFVIATGFILGVILAYYAVNFGLYLTIIFLT